MKEKSILNEFPCCDIEELSYEVEYEKYYSNAVTYFDDALKQNLFYIKSLRDENVKKEYDKYENRNVSYFRDLYTHFTLYQYIQDKETNEVNAEKVSDIDSFIDEVVLQSIRGEDIILELAVLIPNEKIIILIGHDLKLIHFYPKRSTLNPIILQLFEKYGMSWE